MDQTAVSAQHIKRPFAIHGWIGLGLVAVFWAVNWLLPGVRTMWAFFPMWLGYALVVDALALRSNGTSLLARNRKAYAGLFLLSIPGWWLFEALNLRVQNWNYLGTASLTPLQFFIMASINFSIVVPAIFGASEWFSGMNFIQRMGKGPILRPDRRTTWTFFILGILTQVLLLLWPKYFFPFTWLSVLFILEPLNVWLGHRSLSEYTQKGDWKPLVSLFCGVLFTGFFWEMWNFYSYPKWIYTVPWVGNLKVFEMPILGYTGYLPFSLELFALYHLMTGALGNKQGRYIRLDPAEVLNKK
jgi:hypothetical protein